MSKQTGSAHLAEPPKILDQGVDGVLVRFSDRLDESANRAVLALSAALTGDEAPVPGLAEVSSALASVYLRFDGDVAAGRAALRRLLADVDFRSAELPAGRRLWRIPAVFGGAHGPLLDAVSSEIGLSPAEAVDDIAKTRLRVLAIGFAPGQPYLGELGARWDVPRLGQLAQVPAGAIVVAIRQIVLFANASPTGWRQVGQTAFRCFRPDAAEPMALAPGDEVVFRPVSVKEFEAIRAEDKTGDGGATAEPIP